MTLWAFHIFTTSEVGSRRLRDALEGSISLLMYSVSAVSLSAIILPIQLPAP